LVTILFTDLVGSTALSQDVGDTAADNVRREHFNVLRQAIGRTGGTEVKSIGDALMVSYPAAADAIAGAVAMQQGVDVHNRRSAGVRLAMRVGISAGDATFEDGDWFGTPVVEASRLCTAAEGGQILVTDIVRVLAGSRAEHELRSVGEIVAKGLTAPITACEIVWAPVSERESESRSVPLPPVIDQVDTFAFVGRSAERDTLVDAWKDVVAGGRRVVLIAGEPGIGKTRLVKEVCRLAHDHGGLVLWGGCEEDLGIPYQPFAEALRWYATAGPIDDLRELLGTLGGELIRLIPDLDRLVPGLAAPVNADPDTERYRLFESVVELVAALSARTPTLLVLDDVHWAAKPTLLMLRHLLRASNELRVLIVATYRDTDLDRTHPLADMLADLRREPTVERLALTGLDEQGVTEFLERTAGHALDHPGRALAVAVHGETEGNPFFIGEVLLHLVESGAIVFRDGRYSVARALDDVGIPEGVREVIGRRLSTLDPATNEVLSAASVIGREFEVGLLTTLSDGEEEVVLDALEAAERTGLVSAVPGRAAQYRFSHALVRSTLYDELTTSRRLRLHRAVARALAERPDAPTRLPELARHFSECAALGEVDRAVEYCRRAGDAALAEVAFEEAANYYERALGALELADDPDLATRADLLTAAGAALVIITDPRGRDLLYAAAEIARDLGDPARLADAAISLHRDASTREMLRVDEPMVALLEEALDTVDADDLARRALLTSALVPELLWSPDRERRLTLADEALDLARRAGDDLVLARVLAQQSAGYDNTDPRIIDRYADESAEIIALASTLDDPALLFGAYTHRILGSILVGNRTTLDADLDAVDALAARLRQPALEFRSRTLRTAQTLISGRLDDAERQIAELGEYWAAHRLTQTGTIGVLAFRLHYERGRLADFEPFLLQLIAEQASIVTWRVALLSVYASTDRLDDAREHLHVLAADDFAIVPRDVLWVVSIAGIARIAGLAGELDIAQRAYNYMLPFRGVIAGTGQSAEQPVALSIGTAAAALGRFEDAEQLYAEAIDLSERLGAPTFVAATRVQWAQTLLDPAGPHDVTRARELAQQALATAEELGLGRVAELSRRVLST
jgi:class 3 adenylate cyclase/tetratricopeptide (TPR) repeat protein